MERTFDVIVVGAGPGGSSIATLLAKAGASTLLVDQAHFPRDKVCGDGVTPRGLYWLEVLGCLDEIIDAAPSCVADADVHINGRHVLTGTYPAVGTYPGFSIIIPRKILDYIMLKHAVRQGACFHPGFKVRRLIWSDTHIRVEGISDGQPATFRAQIVVGADGSNSMVSRLLDNRIREGMTAVSMRGYYRDVFAKGSKIQVYFAEPYFPGYGWIFADEAGMANVGVGLIVDSDFPARSSLRRLYDDFISRDISAALEGAKPVDKPRGGWTSIFKPQKIVADRVILIGDAANQGDPIRADGIHMAMDSAHLAAPAVLEALRRKEYSAATLGRYQTEWNRRNEADWRIGELVLTASKNSQIRDFLLSGVKVVAALAAADSRFEKFVGGVFSGANQPSNLMNPKAWLESALFDPRILLRILTEPDTGVSEITKQAQASLRRVIASPLPTLGWGVEMLAKSIGLGECNTRNGLRMEG